MSNRKPVTPTRNRDFAIATITVHAAAARKPRNKKKYTRKDKSWRNE